MKRRATQIFTPTFIVLTVLLGLAACNSNETLLQQNSSPAKQTQTAATPAPTDNARRIDAEELYKLWEKNDVLIIDTRTDSAYKQEHIKGSISIPAGTVLSHLEELPRDKMIVAYCT